MSLIAWSWLFLVIYIGGMLALGVIGQRRIKHADDFATSYCQIWCTEGWSCDGPAVLGDLDTVVELDTLDDLAELAEAA